MRGNKKLLEYIKIKIHTLCYAFKFFKKGTKMKELFNIK